LRSIDRIEEGTASDIEHHEISSTTERQRVAVTYIAKEN